MALPTNVGFGTITGRLIDSAGVPIAGTFTFTPSATSLKNNSASPKVVILPKPVKIDLDVNGAFSVALIATDDTDNSPVNWTYRVDFQANTAGVSLDTFNTDVPENSNRDLASLVPVAVANGVAITRGVGVPSGGTPGQTLIKVSSADGDTIWGTVSGSGGAVSSVSGRVGNIILTKADVGLSVVDNTSDANKPLSTAANNALNAKADLVNGTVPLSQLPSNIGSGSGGGAVASVAGKTGTVTLVKGDVGLANVDNTADASKPISAAQQVAIDAKAPTASPTFTGVVSGITKAMVGLTNVDNTSDANKPVSTAVQAALNLKAASTELTQGLANKANVTHGHAVSDITNLQATLDGLSTQINAAAKLATYVDGQTPPAASDLAGDNWIVVAVSS